MNSSNLGKNYIQCVVANHTLLLYVIYTVSKEKKQLCNVFIHQN